MPFSLSNVPPPLEQCLTPPIASAYLSLTPDAEPKGVTNGHTGDFLITPKPGIPGYYFLDSELVNSGLLPVLGLLKRDVDSPKVAAGWSEIVGRVLCWREAYFDIWDPCVAWWAYGGYLTGTAMVGLWKGEHLDVETKDE